MSLEFAYANLLYCCEVWGECGQGAENHEATRTSLAAACTRVLDVRGAPGLYAIGELGLLNPTARMYSQRLAFWFDLLLQPPTRYTRWTYQCSLRAYNSGYGGITWCRATHAMLQHMGPPYTLAWAAGDVARQRQWLTNHMGEAPPSPSELQDQSCYLRWRKQVRVAARHLVREWAEAQWRAAVATSHTLTLFARLHPYMRYARYLDCVHAPSATRLRARLRSGTYPLAEHMAYRRSGHDRDSQQYRMQARCPLCGAPQETVSMLTLTRSQRVFK